MLTGGEKGEPKDSELRQLRFADADLESEFREDYAEKARRQVRFIMAVMVPVVLVQIVFGVVVRPGALSEPAFWLSSVETLVLALSGIWLTYSRHYVRFSQPYVALFLLLSGLGLIQRAITMPLGFTAMIVFPWATYTLARLRLLSAVLVAWTVIAAFEMRSVWDLHTPLATLRAQNFPILLSNVFGMVAGYMLEQSARRDFLLQRLLAGERKQVEAERQRSERLLLSILPGPIAERLKNAQATIADSFPEVSVLFADIVDFTPLSAALSPEEVVGLLNSVFSAFDRLAEKHGLEKIKTIGDSYMLVGGLSAPRADHADAVAEMALDMQETIGRYQREGMRDGGGALRLRIGINTGPVVAGVIGTSKFSYDLWGDTVNTASRMESHGVAGAIQVTQATYERLRDGYSFQERGSIEVKGKGPVRVHLLQSRLAPAAR